MPILLADLPFALAFGLILLLISVFLLLIFVPLFLLGMHFAWDLVNIGARIAVISA